MPAADGLTMHPTVGGILESSLYVADVPRSIKFYEDIFAFRVISDFGDRGCAMQAGERQVLLLFKKRGSLSMETPHAIAAADLANWEAWLAENGIAIEETKKWEAGGISLYFRDPDRHLLEIATPGVWSIY